VSRFIAGGYHEEFLGDLQEVYDQRISEKGALYAKAMYWFDAIHLLAGFWSLRSSKSTSSNMMVANMIKVAWRSALRQKQFTVLNIAGLTIGIATCLFIGLYVYDELSYDTFHTKGDRIYRINQPLIWANWDAQFASTGPNVAIALRTDAPEFEQVTRLRSLGQATLNVPAPGKELNAITEDKYFAADPNFFEIFSFKFIQGDPTTCLLQPNSMVMTEGTAMRYFGEVNALGKTVSVKEQDGKWAAYNVTGVLADIPHRSHIQFDILVSMETFAEEMKRDDFKWIFTSFSTYALVRESTDIPALTKKIQAIPPKWAALTTERIFNQSFSEYTRGKPWTLYMQPLRDIYLSNSPGYHRFGPNGNPQFVKIFGAIGVLVLALCSINFMNLSTARSSNRSKEVGIRKVMGSERNALVRQFIFESILFVLVSTLCAFFLVQLSLNGFNTIAEKRLELLPNLTSPIFLAVAVTFVVLLGVAAGSYPAFYLSSFRPIETLKGKASAGFKGKGIRNALVIFQFTISITLIICTAFVQKQLSYSSSLDTGFVKDNVLQIHKIEQLGANGRALKNTLASDPAIAGVARSFGIPPNVWEGERYKAFGPETTAVDISNLRVDEDYLPLLGVQFLAGRNFDAARVTDKYAIILNEEAVKVLGFGTRDTYDANSPIGKFVVPDFDSGHKLEIIGVVKDFNFNSVKQKIDPLMVLHHENDWFWNYGAGASFLSIRLNPATVTTTAQVQAVIEHVKDQVAKLDGSVPFEYSFMDQDFEETFRSEMRMGAVLNMFTVMAVIIACLGLFGLAAFSAEQRTKELGIRKVLGAKVSELMATFSFEFTRLIVVAIFLASGISWFLVNEWLKDFAYRTPIDIWVFVASTAGAMLLAVLTISYQSFIAANANPAETLRIDG
jgi:putative ABC transport system permease protein